MMIPDATRSGGDLIAKQAGFVLSINYSRWTEAFAANAVPVGSVIPVGFTTSDGQDFSPACTLFWIRIRRSVCGGSRRRRCRRRS